MSTPDGYPAAENADDISVRHRRELAMGRISVSTVGTPASVASGAEAHFGTLPVVQSITQFRPTPHRMPSMESLPMTPERRPAPLPLPPPVLWVAQEEHFLLRPPRVVCRRSPGEDAALRIAVTAQAIGTVEVPAEADVQCAICLEDVADGDKVQPMLQCSHLFHEECVRSLVEARLNLASEASEGLTAMTCPLCRGRLAAENVFELPEDERCSAALLVATRRMPWQSI